VLLLVIHNHTFAFQQDIDPAITKTAALAGIHFHLFADFELPGERSR